MNVKNILNKFFVLVWIIPFVFITSCTLVEPEVKKPEIPSKQIKTTVKKQVRTGYNSGYSVKDSSYIKKDGIACGVASCDLKNYLKGEYASGKLKLDNKKLELYQKRLGALLDFYNDPYKMITKDDFKKLTGEMQKDFFGSEAGESTSPYNTRTYGEDELNYLFYIFIPDIVVKEYVLNRGGDELIAEDIIQAIKRQDFDSHDTKEMKVALYKQKLLDFVDKIDLSQIDKDKLKKDNDYFAKIVLTPNTGLHDKIVRQTVSSINTLGWTQKGQLAIIQNYTFGVFYKVMKSLGISEKDFENKLIAIYKYDKNKDLLSSLVSDLNKKSEEMKQKYNLEKTMILDRYFRNDELFLFSKDNLYSTLERFAGKTADKDSFYKDSIILGQKVLLVFNIGRASENFFLPNRLKLYNSKNTFIITNIFKTFKYINGDKYNLLSNPL